MTNKRSKRGEYGVKTDLTGQKFGYLEVIKMAHKLKDTRREYRAVCKCHNCGKENHWVFPYHLTKIGQKSCGCLPRNMPKGKDHCKYSGYGEITGSIWGKIKEAAYRRNLEFSITIEETWELFQKQNKKCALTLLPIEMGVKRLKGTASLDRKDSAKGYTKDNIQWVHRNVNIVKHSCSQEYFVNICRRVVNNEALKYIPMLSDEDILKNSLFAKGCLKGWKKDIK